MVTAAATHSLIDGGVLCGVEWGTLLGFATGGVVLDGWVPDIACCPRNRSVGRLDVAQVDGEGGDKIVPKCCVRKESFMGMMVHRVQWVASRIIRHLVGKRADSAKLLMYGGRDVHLPSHSGNL